MQILHPFRGSVEDYSQQLVDPNRFRPLGCPLCEAKTPLVAHGFYRRSLVDRGFDGLIRVRRYLCRLCRRTVSLLPEFTLPYLRFGIDIVARFLKARLIEGETLRAAARQAGQPEMPYQRGQGWVARFRRQATALAAGLAALTRPLPAPDFVHQAVGMLEAAGWIPSHRFLFAQLRVHLLGWPRCLAPDGRSRRFASPRSASRAQPHNTCIAPSVPGP